jgi:hypothetical protein
MVVPNFRKVKRSGYDTAKMGSRNSPILHFKPFLGGIFRWVVDLLRKPNFDPNIADHKMLRHLFIVD